MTTVKHMVRLPVPARTLPLVIVVGVASRDPLLQSSHDGRGADKRSSHGYPTALNFGSHPSTTLAM
jgi:hypothetical protein